MSQLEKKIPEYNTSISNYDIQISIAISMKRIADFLDYFRQLSEEELQK